MKTVSFWSWSLGLALAALPFVEGCDQQSAISAPVDSSVTNQAAAPAAAGNTNAPSAEAAEQELEQAPGQVVSTATAPPPDVALSAPATDVVKLAQAGVDESVMLSFVTNAPNTFNLSSDAIVYLNDIGVPGDVVTAMIQHDQAVKQSSAAYAAAPHNATPLISPPGTASAYSSAPNETPAPEQGTTEAAPGAAPAQAPNVSYTYFYDSLTPYGSWINVNGYGLCWQPTAVVVNPGWQPYCDNGRWAYTDSGWCWVSDYSWGWAPFHYGRWFHHRRWGWCWAPDTVWGPAWVSWRYGQSYCGWAPLPPAACFTPGIGFTFYGRHVGFGFGFGLSVGSFTFVGFDHFGDRRWHDHRVPPHHVRGFYDRTIIANRVVERNRVIINEGIPVSRVAAAMHREIPRVHISDVRNPGSARFDRGERPGRTLAVYRPNLPTPAVRTPTRLVGEGIAPKAGFHVNSVRPGNTPGAVRNAESGTHQTEPRTVLRTMPSASPNNQAHPGNAAVGQARGTAAQPLVQRSWERPTPAPVAHPSAQREVSGEQPKPAVQNNTRVFAQPYQQLQNRPASQGSTEVYRAQSPPRIVRPQSPKYTDQQQQSGYNVQPQQRQSESRAYQEAPAVQSGEQQRWVSPRQRTEQPSFSAPRTVSPERVQPAPQAPNRGTPAPARSAGNSNYYSNSRH